MTYCPLVSAWATTIHKFQGFEAGFDINDQFKQLIVDPGDLTTKLLNPGTLYVALSRAKLIGTITPNELHPKDSALFWTGSGMYLNRVLNVTHKKGNNGNNLTFLSPIAQKLHQNISNNSPSKLKNSLTPKSVPAGTKLVLFGRYVLNIYVGIV